MTEEYPRPKVWRHPKVLSEHAFDKLRLLDCTLAEFESAIEHAEIIEERTIDGEGSLKELVLVVDWTRRLHPWWWSMSDAGRNESSPSISPTRISGRRTTVGGVDALRTMRPRRAPAGQASQAC